jgi:hypothetical protein
MTTRVELVGSSFMTRFGFGRRSVLPQSKAIYFNPISFKLGIHFIRVAFWVMLRFHSIVNYIRVFSFGYLKQFKYYFGLK